MQQQRVLAVAGLAALFVGILVAVLAGVSAGGGDEQAASPSATQPAAETTKAPPVAAKPAPVRLRGLRGYDPEGDGRERDETAALATDGNAATAWTTERYSSFFKDGVGLLLDAGKPVTLTRVVVRTATPGVVAAIRVGANPGGPFTPVTVAKRLTATTTFTPRARRGRYVVVWVDDIPGGGTAEINEVRAWRAGGAS
ncbi:MAG: hypothetical protein OEW31_12530 [Thermoleophilia bacterium]|nr:hypothetical protein [Thermoleophilia bacterium]MDH4347151.1 hypothetical protein [Thermoleophilia bacterium]